MWSPTWKLGPIKNVSDPLRATPNGPSHLVPCRVPTLKKNAPGSNNAQRKCVLLGYRINASEPRPRVMASSLCGVCVASVAPLVPAHGVGYMGCSSNLAPEWSCYWLCGPNVSMVALDRTKCQGSFGPTPRPHGRFGQDLTSRKDSVRSEVETQDLPTLSFLVR